MTIRTALVTGATDGIGLEIARKLTLRGVRVTGTGRNLPGEGDARFDACARWAAADQDDPHHAARTILEAATGEPLDVAILCAGMGRVPGEGQAEGADTIRRTLRVNLEATIVIAHALAPALLDRNGTLVLVGSVARKGAAIMPSYAASKAGMHGFARALGEEWRGRATVAMLHPGPTRTAIHAKAGLDVGRLARLFVPADVMADTIIARTVRAHDTLRPHFATLAWRANGGRWLASLGRRG